MKTPLALAGAACLFVLAGMFFSRFTAPAAEAGATTAESQVEHGRYLTHQVSMCIDCHSPRGEDGRFIENRHLTGTTLPFAATVPMPWAPAAPNLAGLPPGYEAEDMVKFLMTGQRPHGLPPARPPMPEIRLNQADAEAMTAYLISLAPVPEAAR